jgi:outer membrane lipoprotein SlyB
MLGRLALVSVVGTGLMAGGCGDNAGQGALGGAAIGALAGTGIGSLSGDMGKGAAAGAIGGAVLGGIIGDQNRRRDERDRYRDY